jgi:NAD-dependent dihydropyrimidine dehydrogenase PreA subunit
MTQGIFDSKRPPQASMKDISKRGGKTLITEIDNMKCTGCGICIDLCNMDVLRLNTDSNKAYIAYPEDCMTCFECALSCPEKAVSVSFMPGFVPASVVHPQRG